MTESLVNVAQKGSESLTSGLLASCVAVHSSCRCSSLRRDHVIEQEADTTAAHGAQQDKIRPSILIRREGDSTVQVEGLLMHSDALDKNDGHFHVCGYVQNIVLPFLDNVVAQAEKGGRRGLLIRRGCQTMADSRTPV